MKAGIDYIGVGCGAFILNDKKEILLIKRGKNSKNEAGCWNLPGGAVEFNETFSDALKREIKEEIDIDIEVIDLICLTDHILKDEGQHWVTPSVLCKIIKGEPKSMEPGKIDDIKWFSLHNLPSQLTLSLKKAIDAYKNNIRIQK